MDDYNCLMKTSIILNGKKQYSFDLMSSNDFKIYISQLKSYSNSTCKFELITNPECVNSFKMLYNSNHVGDVDILNILNIKNKKTFSISKINCDETSVNMKYIKRLEKTELYNFNIPNCCTIDNDYTKYTSDELLILLESIALRWLKNIKSPLIEIKNKIVIYKYFNMTNLYDIIFGMIKASANTGKTVQLLEHEFNCYSEKNKITPLNISELIALVKKWLRFDSNIIYYKEFIFKVQYENNNNDYNFNDMAQLEKFLNNIFTNTKTNNTNTSTNTSVKIQFGRPINLLINTLEECSKLGKPIDLFKNDNGYIEYTFFD